MTKQLPAFPVLLANGLSIYLKPIKNKPSISTSVLNLGVKESAIPRWSTYVIVVSRGPGWLMGIV